MQGCTWLALAAAVAPWPPGAWAAAAKQCAKEAASTSDPAAVQGRAMLQTQQASKSFISAREEEEEEGVQACGDDNQHCAYWANIGECAKNPGYMLTYCKLSCKVCEAPIQVCTDGNQQCAHWANIGECARNPGYMLVNCKSSCGVCKANDLALMGCFKDDGNRAFNGGFRSVGRGADTVSKCAALCEGKTYMAIQYFDECFCGNTYETGSQYAEVPPHECSFPCPVAHGCGAAWRNSVYKMPATSPTLVGCFQDQANSAFHAEGQYVGRNAETVSACAAVCTGKSYMAIRGGQCLCGNTFARNVANYEQRPLYWCNVPNCPVTNGCGGGGLVNSVYTLPVTTTCGYAGDLACTGTDKKVWNGKSEAQCIDACEGVGVAGCCEALASGSCQFFPGGTVASTKAATGTKTTMCNQEAALRFGIKAHGNIPGLALITSKELCADAAKALGFEDTTVAVVSHGSGCTYKNNELQFGLPSGKVFSNRDSYDELVGPNGKEYFRMEEMAIHDATFACHKDWHCIYSIVEDLLLSKPGSKLVWHDFFRTFEGQDPFPHPELLRMWRCGSTGAGDCEDVFRNPITLEASWTRAVFEADFECPMRGKVHVWVDWHWSRKSGNVGDKPRQKLGTASLAVNGRKQTKYFLYGDTRLYFGDMELADGNVMNIRSEVIKEKDFNAVDEFTGDLVISAMSAYVTCEEMKVCVKLLAKNDQLRVSNTMQLQCLEGGLHDTTCQQWVQCLEESHVKNTLLHLLRAAVLDPDDLEGISMAEQADVVQAAQPAVLGMAAEAAEAEATPPEAPAAKEATPPEEPAAELALMGGDEEGCMHPQNMDTEAWYCLCLDEMEKACHEIRHKVPRFRHALCLQANGCYDPFGRVCHSWKNQRRRCIKLQAYTNEIENHQRASLLERANQSAMVAAGGVAHLDSTVGSKAHQCNH